MDLEKTYRRVFGTPPVVTTASEYKKRGRRKVGKRVVSRIYLPPFLYRRI